jgi:hypothetical protein
VTSRDEPASIVAARVLGSALPELFDLRLPPRGMGVDLERCVGRYASAAWTADVAIADGALELAVAARNGARIERSPLRPMAGGLFFPVGARTDRFPYVQFVRGDRRDRSADRSSDHDGDLYLWNGQFLLPRETARSPV